MANRTQLGAGEDLQVVLSTRGNERNLAILNPREKGTFTRVLDRCGEAKLTISVDGALDVACCEALRDLNSWATEIVIYRDVDPVTGRKRDAFGGPVVDVDWEYGEVNIVAKGLTAWWDRRILPVSAPGLQDASDYFNLYHGQAMAADPIQGFNVTATPTGILIEREITKPTYASEAMKELADSTIDFTEYGRNLIVGGGEVPAEPYVTLNDSHFQKPLEVRERGGTIATRIIAMGNGVIGMAEDADAMAFYGLVERIVEAEFISTQNEIDAYAQTTLDLVKSPYYIESPSNAGLKPTAPITLQELIPGMRIRIDANATCRGLVADFRLHEVTVGFDGSVKIKCQPLGATV